MQSKDWTVSDQDGRLHLIIVSVLVTLNKGTLFALLEIPKAEAIQVVGFAIELLLSNFRTRFSFMNIEHEPSNSVRSLLEFDTQLLLSLRHFLNCKDPALGQHPTCRRLLQYCALTLAGFIRDLQPFLTTTPERSCPQCHTVAPGLSKWAWRVPQYDLLAQDIFAHKQLLFQKVSQIQETWKCLYVAAWKDNPEIGMRRVLLQQAQRVRHIHGCFCSFSKIWWSKNSSRSEGSEGCLRVRGEVRMT